MRVWNPVTSICEKTFLGHTASVTSLAVLDDGARLASGSADKT